MSDERLERALREIKRAGLERAIVGRLLREMSDEDVSSLAHVGNGLLGAIERMSVEARRTLRFALIRPTEAERRVHTVSRTGRSPTDWHDQMRQALQHGSISGVIDDQVAALAYAARRDRQRALGDDPSQDSTS